VPTELSCQRATLSLRVRFGTPQLDPCGQCLWTSSLNSLSCLSSLGLPSGHLRCWPTWTVCAERTVLGADVVTQGSGRERSRSWRDYFARGGRAYSGYAGVDWRYGAPPDQRTHCKWQSCGRYIPLRQRERFKLAKLRLIAQKMDIQPR